MGWWRGELGAQLAAQHAELLAALSAQHNAVIEKLDALNTTLTNNALDVTPIVDAITLLRGDGPENTIKSVNTSIWNIAGPAPGTNLTDLKLAIAALQGIGLDNTLQGVSDRINIIEATLDGNLPNLIGHIIDIKNQWYGGGGMTPYNILDGIYTGLVGSLIAQFDTSTVYPTMKDLLITISQQQAQLVGLAGNPLTTMPDNICASPLVSTGRAYVDISTLSATPLTVATWPETIDGFSTNYTPFTQAYAQISCDDWSRYRVFVASKADWFGIGALNFEKFPTNEWITFAVYGWGIVDFIEFQVERDQGLTVYICPVDAGVPTCVGYENYNHYGPFDFIAGQVDGSDSYHYFPLGMAIDGLMTSNLGWYEGYTDVIEWFSSATAIDVCVAVEVEGSISSLSVARRTALGGYAQHQFVTGEISDETRTFTMEMEDGVQYAIHATSPTGSLRCWFTLQELQ